MGDNLKIVIQYGPTTRQSGSPATDSRPIIGVFQRFIEDSSDLISISDIEIFAILQTEFNINLSALHPLELTIYLNIFKTFFKEWPQWNEFDSNVKQLQRINAVTAIKNILEHYYKKLKQYFQTVFEKTKPLAEKAVQDLAKEELQCSDELRDIFLELQCSRKQLNGLIFNKPHPEHNNTIFNIPPNDQKIFVRKFPIESILNYPDVKLTINLNFFNYIRSTKHELKHMLTNDALNAQEEKITLKTDIQRKNTNASSTNWKKKSIMLILDKLTSATNGDRKKLNCLLNVVKSDLECMATNVVEIPGLYRQHSNAYPYYRKLFTAVKKEDCTNAEYDLHVKETIYPMHMFDIIKLTKIRKNVQVPANFSWIRVECLACNVSFSHDNFIDELIGHFKEQHVDEPDWICTNCNKSFTMIELSFKKWRHVCAT